MNTVDPGYPFSRPYASLIESLESQIRQGAEQPAEAVFTYQDGMTRYSLPRLAASVFQVGGQVAGNLTVFESDRDYRFINNQIAWDAAESDRARRPDIGTEFTVEYAFRERPSGLNDFSPGSVVGTLVRAFAREVKLLYDQMDEAYRRAFIDVATGFALDNVVALLGVERNTATQATGTVIFSRNQTSQALQIPVGTRVANERGQIFSTTTVATFQSGAAELEVAIAATEPGPEGNVEARAITVMPTPPPGVDGVENRAPTTGGQDPENDESLRERAKNALARAGNATLTAIEFAVRDVDEIQEVEVRDHTRDETIPVGEVRVRYSSDDAVAIQDVVDRTRAAGILARLERVIKVLMSGTFYVIANPNGDPNALSAFQRAVVAALNTLNIGEPLSIRRLTALAFNAGLADVAEAQLVTHPEDSSNERPVTDDPFAVSSNELIRPREDDLQVVQLMALNVVNPRTLNADSAIANQTFEEEALTIHRRLQVWDESQKPVAFRDYRLNVNITLRASLRQAPDQPPERIGSLLRSLQLTNTDQVELAFAANDQALNFDTERYAADVEARINMADYPGIQSMATRVVMVPLTALQAESPRLVSNIYEIDFQLLDATETAILFNSFSLAVQVFLADSTTRTPREPLSRTLDFRPPSTTVASIATLRLTTDNLTDLGSAPDAESVTLTLRAVDYDLPEVSLTLNRNG